MPNKKFLVVIRNAKVIKNARRRRLSFMTWWRMRKAANLYYDRSDLNFEFALIPQDLNNATSRQYLTMVFFDHLDDSDLTLYMPTLGQPLPFDEAAYLEQLALNLNAKIMYM